MICHDLQNDRPNDRVRAQRTRYIAQRGNDVKREPPTGSICNELWLTTFAYRAMHGTRSSSDFRWRT